MNEKNYNLVLAGLSAQETRLYKHTLVKQTKTNAVDEFFEKVIYLFWLTWILCAKDFYGFIDV